MITTRVLTGSELESALDDVAALRISVFRHWPYLYDGSIAYERDYLQTYRDSKAAVLVGTFDGERLVGASTGTPMVDHSEDFGAAFAASKIPLEQVFYCAESVLLPEYRGQGIGHAFFDHREAHAKALGFQKICFCGVIRPKDHPLRPENYAPLDPFWRKRGYAPLENVIAQFAWKDLDQSEETEKSLQFWMKDL